MTLSIMTLSITIINTAQGIAKFSVMMLNIDTKILSVVMLSVVHAEYCVCFMTMLCVFMHTIVMLSVVLLSVILLNVVAMDLNDEGELK